MDLRRWLSGHVRHCSDCQELCTRFKTSLASAARYMRLSLTSTQRHPFAIRGFVLESTSSR